ncbi:hypothetical protein [Marinifilum sp.]|uniref:hypothetical protein n=1 Tax=Marinifilum sp. TaxID=2033137 RepID=UPI003BAB06DE
MKKKILLSLVGVVCFGFLFSHSLVSNENSIETDNLKVLAKEVKPDENRACAHVVTRC